jgi:hypothetical protein
VTTAPMAERPSTRLRRTPLAIWGYLAVSVAVAPFVGVAVNEYRLAEPLAWTGVSLAVLLTLGLALQWRVVWVAAFALELFLGATALATAVTTGAPGLVMLVKSVAAVAFLLSASTRVHVFGSAAWRDPAPSDG